MRVFVTGGSGFVGGHLIPRLVGRGWEVVALARSEQAARKVEALGAVSRPGDLSVVADLVTAMDGSAHVFHCAASVGSWGDPAEHRRTNVEGTRNVVDAACAADVTRLIHLSTESVYLDGRSLEDVTEMEPVPSSGHLSWYASTKAAGERIVLAGNGPALETVVVRPRLVWGPGDGTWLPGLVEKVDSGVFRWVDGGRHRGSTCHVFNLVEALLLAAERGRPGEAYFVTDGDVWTFRDFASGYLAAAGIDRDFGSVPGWLMRGAGALVEGIWKLGRFGSQPPLNRVEAAMVGHEMVLDDSKARTELGYEPVITIDEGLARLREDSDLGDPVA